MLFLNPLYLHLFFFLRQPFQLFRNSTSRWRYNSILCLIVAFGFLED